MRIMPSNNSGLRVGYLAGRYPGKLGHLYSPGGQRGPYPFMPYALDNGAYGAYLKGVEWQPEPWREMLSWSRLSGQSPLWVLVPDAVGNKVATLAQWDRYAGEAAKFGPLAFAVQDGMTPDDVPFDAAVVFVGGSTEFKWRTVASWCNAFQRVHVGRVNTWRRLAQCERVGAESVDGTGFTRGDQRQWRGLEAFLAGQRCNQLEFEMEVPV